MTVRIRHLSSSHHCRLRSCTCPLQQHPHACPFVMAPSSRPLVCSSRPSFASPSMTQVTQRLDDELNLNDTPLSLVSVTPCLPCLLHLPRPPHPPSPSCLVSLVPLLPRPLSPLDLVPLIPRLVPCPSSPLSLVPLVPLLVSLVPPSSLVSLLVSLVPHPSHLPHPLSLIPRPPPHCNGVFRIIT